jgi:hypothetical protein
LIILTDAGLTYDQAQKLIRDHFCGQCGANLNVAWGGAFKVNGYILRCAKDIKHDTITKHEKKSEQRLEAEKQWKEINHMDSKALMVMTESAMLERIDKAKFPQALTKEEKILLAAAAITYGLDPLMGELSIYQGRPFVSIDGRYRKAQETGKLAGVETRPANQKEKTDWEIPNGDYFFRSEVYVKGIERPFVGWGRVFASETQGGKGFKPVEKNPQRMAEKRAEAQALRKAFHIPLPSAEDIGSLELVETTSGPVNVKTGEVVEGTAKVVEDNCTGPDPAQDATTPGSELTKLVFANMMELLNAAQLHFGLDKQAVLRETIGLDLNKPDQRKQGWASICGSFRPLEAEASKK